MPDAAKVLPAWLPYRPSNGTEGEMFMEEWCAKCARDAAARNQNYAAGCRILAKTLLYDLGDPEYPREWIRPANDDSWPGGARCTAFVPLSELTERAKRAWATRKQNLRDAHACDLFTKGGTDA